MKTKLVIGIVLSAVFLSFYIARPATAQPLIDENFDAYAVGAYPASPWWTMFSGVSGAVSAEQATSAPNSLRLESLPNWARWDCVAINAPQAQVVTCQASFYCTDITRGAAVGFGFVDPGNPSTGWLANAVLFDNNGQISWVTKTAGSSLIGAWGGDHWWTVAIVVTYPSMQAEVYLYTENGLYDSLSGLPADPKVLPPSYYGVEVPLNNFGVLPNNFTGTGTSVVYVDDVRVETVDVLPVRKTTWGGVKSLYRTE
ncbi:MAG TPA: hypothetical protein VFH88_07400 [Candidatus Krumholzibacteria bacterium]|nr:hypothetical protein [Candidatus Krumholzibacteria bacterium]